MTAAIPFTERVIHETHVLTDSSPLSVYRTLYGDECNTFLYESLQTDGTRGRYSFLGGRPLAIAEVNDGGVLITQNGESRADPRHPNDVFRDLLQTLPQLPSIEPLAGGLVGFFAYDYVNRLETLPSNNPDELQIPDARFMLPSELIIFDHQQLTTQIVLIGIAANETRQSELRAVLHRNESAQLDDPMATINRNSESVGESVFRESMDRDTYKAAVNHAKEYVFAGDIFQTVISRRLSFDLTVPPIDLYAGLRETNPSQYMYYLNFEDFQVLGSSPELLAEKRGNQARVRPLAGTRPRGSNAAEDTELERDLRGDVKERAEHIMLVDLARNDLGRVCEFGSVETTNLLDVERYARVMHLVSNVGGTLRDDCDAFDLFEAAFPAGTVSGAPKIRAMEIIDELETTRRGLYAGAIGYISATGDMDMCIAIRNIVVRAGVAHIQAGAGIVADSDPEAEYQETLNKAGGMLRALTAVGMHS